MTETDVVARLCALVEDGEPLSGGAVASVISGWTATLEARALADRMEAMQRLTAGFAHELRNPLNAARLQLELVRQLKPASVDDPTELALFELQAIADLVDDFLLFARPTALEAGDHDIVSLVDQALDRVNAFAHERDVEVSTRAIAASATVDAQKVVFVIEELLHNAIEAAHRHVAIDVAADPDSVRIAVRDDGPGIPPTLVHRIYEPFFTTRDTGRGLGLAIVFTFVRLHRGCIEVTSNERGTCFDVRLPRIA